MARGGKWLVLIFIIILVLMLLNYGIAAEETDSDKEKTAVEDKPSSGGTSKDEGASDSSELADASKEISSFEWVYNKTTDNVGSVVDDSFAVIALLAEGDRDISQLVDRLKTRMDKTAGCWPTGGCKVKDTSLAVLAMYLSGQDEEAKKGVDWLKSARIAGLKGGEWWLVIKGTSPEGSCVVSYKQTKKTFNFVEDKIREVGGKYYINLVQIAPGILSSGILPTINVDCSGLPGSIVTLLHKPNPNTFFIQKSETAANVELKVANVCFGESKTSSSCDYESSLYATWVLVELGQDGLSFDEIGDTLYLQSKVKTTNIKDLALLNRILYRAGNVAPSFVKELASRQKQGGDWEGDVFTTSLATFGLLGNSEHVDVVNRGAAYLERRRNVRDGSWDNNIKSTSMALITLHGVDLAKGNVGRVRVPVDGSKVSGTKEDCSNGIDDDGDEFADCGDTDCEEEKVKLCSNNEVDECEEGVDCGGFCNACEGEQEPKGTETSKECEANSDCDTGQECVGGKCQSKEEEPPEEECKSDDECSDGEECKSGKCLPKEGRSLWWLWLLIILIVIGGGGAFFYLYYVKSGKAGLGHLFKKKPKGPTFEQFKIQQEFKPQPIQRQQVGQPARRTIFPAARGPVTRGPAKSKEDLELERSLKEAERIIKGK